MCMTAGRFEFELIPFASFFSSEIHTFRWRSLVARLVSLHAALVPSCPFGKHVLAAMISQEGMDA